MVSKTHSMIAIALCGLMTGVVGIEPGAFPDSKTSSHNGWKVVLDGTSLKGWHSSDASKPNEWTTCKAVRLSAQDNHFFSTEPGRGVLVNGEKGETVHLISDAQFGDIEAHIEFVVPKESNSGIYFMGLYEVQVFDSYGKIQLSDRDCGGIFARRKIHQGFAGAAPRTNASKPAGEWQSFDVHFRAPRFDAGGKKTENARFLKVTHNGIVIHENVEVDGPTEGALEVPEAREGPLMLQGNHGPVAYRNLRVRQLD